MPSNILPIPRNQLTNNLFISNSKSTKISTNLVINPLSLLRKESSVDLDVYSIIGERKKDEGRVLRTKVLIPEGNTISRESREKKGLREAEFKLSSLNKRVKKKLCGDDGMCLLQKKRT